MASFEDTYGMSWQDAVEQKNEHATELLNQWWVKKRCNNMYLETQ